MMNLGFATYAARKLIVVSGFLSFIIGSAILRVIENMIFEMDWHLLIQNASTTQLLFWFMIFYGFVWIAGSFYGLWKIDKSSELQDRLQSQWWFQQPMLVQIIVFVEHWIMATVYVLLTSDLESGVILAFLSLLHIAVALAIVPRLVTKPD